MEKNVVPEFGHLINIIYMIYITISTTTTTKFHVLHRMHWKRRCISTEQQYLYNA